MKDLMVGSVTKVEELRNLWNLVRLDLYYKDGPRERVIMVQISDVAGDELQIISSAWTAL